MAGDADLVGELLAVRKHSGLMVAGPVQAVMTAMLGDTAHVAQQRERYLARRAVVLRPALEAAGFRIDDSEGSLYLWATRGEDCRATVDCSPSGASWPRRATSTAPRAPGTSGSALTASDERIAAAASRLTAS